MCDNSIVAPAERGRHSPAVMSSGPACAVSGHRVPGDRIERREHQRVTSNATHEREPPRAPIDARGGGEGARRAERAVRPAVGSEVPDADFP